MCLPRKRISALEGGPGRLLCGGYGAGGWPTPYKGGLEEVDYHGQCYDGAHKSGCTTIEYIAFAEAVIHVERLLQSDRFLWSRSFYLYLRLLDGEEQLSASYV